MSYEYTKKTQFKVQDIFLLKPNHLWSLFTLNSFKHWAYYINSEKVVTASQKKRQNQKEPIGTSETKHVSCAKRGKMWASDQSEFGFSPASAWLRRWHQLSKAIK